MSDIETNKKLCERYPYLVPWDCCTDRPYEEFDYQYVVGEGEIPQGWVKLFRQMCEDIRQPLIDAGMLTEFHFMQVKEKFGELRCYYDCAPLEVRSIINKYEHLSRFVCENCGQPAEFETTGWIGEYCDSCMPKNTIRSKRVIFNPIIKYHTFSKEGTKDITLDCTDEWRRLYEKAEKC